MATRENEIIQEFYERPGIMKKRIRLERKLEEAREELDIISDIAGKIILIPDFNGSLYLYFIYSEVYKITVNLGKEIKAMILKHRIESGNREGMLGPEGKDLKTSLKWVIKMLTENC